MTGPRSDEAVPGVAPTGRRATTGQTAGLRRNTIRWPQVAVLSVAGCGPASVIALNLQFMGQFAGTALVLAFVLVWPGILLLVNTFAEFSRRIQTSGGLYTWNSHAWGTNVGFIYGWTFIGSYMVLSAAGFVVFGGWMEQWFTDDLQIPVPWWGFTIVALAYVTFFALRGLAQSMHAALALLGLEILILVALAITIAVKGPAGNISFGVAPFQLDGVQASGLALAMVYAILAHVGIEEGATLGAETEDAKSAIPRGLFIAAVVLPTFYIVIAYFIVYGYGIDAMSAFGGDAAPLQTIAIRYWGTLGLALVVLATGTSILAFSQTVFISGSRVLYTLGRTGVFPRWVGAVSSRSTPRNGIVVMLLATLILGIPLALIAGPFAVWGYYGFLISIAFMVSYILTNIGLILYTRRIGEFRFVRHGVLGVLGSIVFLYPLYKTVWPPQPGVYSALPYIYLSWIGLGAAFLLVMRRRRPVALQEMDKFFQEERG